MLFNFDPLVKSTFWATEIPARNMPPEKKLRIMRMTNPVSQLGYWQ